MRVILQSFNRTNLSSDDMQCPLAGGNAVFRARSLLHLVDQTVYYNDREICNTAGYNLRQMPSQAGENIPKVKLYPNPANESVTVIYEAEKNCKITLTLTNAVGQVVVTYILPVDNTKFKFSTSGLTPAIYSYQVMCDNSAIENGKLVIIH